MATARYEVEVVWRVGSTVVVEAPDAEAAVDQAKRELSVRLKAAGARVNVLHLQTLRVAETDREVGVYVK